MESFPIRVAILDMNNNVANKGLGYIKTLIECYDKIDEYQVFDVRYKCEIPDDSFDIYISTGGPGSPFEMDGIWDTKYFELIEDLMAYNRETEGRKKYMFFICHSFQLACIYFKIGAISEREIMSFGIYPIDRTSDANLDPVFSKLPEPFYAADFRYWQVLQPNVELLKKRGISILAMEHEHLRAPNQHAIMAIRFTPEMIGTQFHPEADDIGMLIYLQEDERRFKIIEEYGEQRYHEMLDHLSDPDKIALTSKIILQSFLDQSIEDLQNAPVSLVLD